MQIEDRELQEIKNRWYKNPLLLNPANVVSLQAMKDVQILISTIEGLKGEVEVGNEVISLAQSAMSKVEKENESLRQQVERYRTALERIAKLIEVANPRFVTKAYETANKALGNSHDS